jgi:hypothetical protein
VVTDEIDFRLAQLEVEQLEERKQGRLARIGGRK